MLDAIIGFLGRTRGGFLRLTIGRGGHCKDVIKLPKTAIPLGGIKPWRHNGPVDVATPYGHANCVLVATNGAFGDVYLDHDMLSQYDDALQQGPIDVQATCGVINRCKTPFVLEDAISDVIDVDGDGGGILVRLGGSVLPVRVEVVNHRQVWIWPPPSPRLWPTSRGTRARC